MKRLKYKNITVSGKIGTGTTTLARLLEKKLKWKYWSGGEFFRDYCRKHKLPLEQTGMRSEDLTRKIDYGMRKRLRVRSGQIMEAWLSGFVAQGVSGVCKILLICRDDLRVDRVVNRDGVAVDVAKKEMRIRERENIKKWRRVYAKEWNDWVVKRGLVKANEAIDFWNPNLYDLVIDTYSYSKEETLKLALRKLRYV